MYFKHTLFIKWLKIVRRRKISYCTFSDNGTETLAPEPVWHQVPNFTQTLAIKEILHKLLKCQ